MKLNLKDEPKEWRKSALLTLFGLAIISLHLRWRGIFADKAFFMVLITLAILVVVASFQPRWFRAYHLLSMRLGLAVSRLIGYVALILFFIFILTPIGLVLQWMGKDVLQLKPRRTASTYWQTSKDSSPLDRLF
jgi:hypothetical protein